MLQFPPWKVALISLTLLVGALMALPNAFSNSFLGVVPERPAAPTAEQLAEYNAERAAAEESWWPGFLPSGKCGTESSDHRLFAIRKNCRPAPSSAAVEWEGERKVWIRSLLAAH
jgi:hypothetical protein